MLKTDENYISPEEYFRMEEKAEGKSELSVTCSCEKSSAPTLQHH